MDAIFDFVKNFTGTSYEDIPGLAVEAAKKEVLDSLATALGGSSQAGVGELVEMVKEWGGNEQSTVIAYGIKCPAPNAAQVNAILLALVAAEIVDCPVLANIHLAGSWLDGVSAKRTVSFFHHYSASFFKAGVS